MASVAISDYRDFLRKKGFSQRADNATDEDLALELKSRLEERNINIEQFASERDDYEFVPLIKKAYGEQKTFFGGATDAIAQQYYTKKQGLKQGLASALGAIGMDETERDLMRSAQRDARQVSEYGKEVFDNYTMIDDFSDFLKYFAQGASRSVVDIVPSMVSSVVGRGIGKKIQKGLEKTDKLSELKSKAKKYLGDNYGAKAGMGAGAFGSSALENTGHVYGDLYEYTRLDPSDEMYLSPGEARALSMFAGGASGALDSAIPVFLVGKLSKSIGKDAAEREVGKLFKSLPEGMVFLAQGAGGEGITEAMQEVVQMATVKYHTKEEWNEKDWERMINGGLLGAIGGGTVTAATGGVSRLLRPQDTAQSDLEEDTESEPLETSDERVEIRNRFEEKRFNAIAEQGVGTVVTPIGSNRLARVLEVEEEERTVLVEYNNGATERLKSSELSIVDSKDKIIKPEDLKNFTDEKLEELKTLKPQLVKQIEKEQEGREEEKDDDVIQTAQTNLEVSSKGNQLIVSDVSSRERVYSATYKVEDGVLTVENQNLDAPTDQRKQESVDLLYRQAKRKAKAEELILNMDGNMEMPFSDNDIMAMDMSQLYNAYDTAIRLRNSLPDATKSVTDDTLVTLALKMEDEGLVELDKGGSLRKLSVTTKKSNSAKIRNNETLGGILAYKVFSELEGDIQSFIDNNPQSGINEKFIKGQARVHAELYAEEIDGLNKSQDVAALADAATAEFVKHHLMDNEWKKPTPFDLALEEEEKKAIELARQQSAAQNFKTHEPRVGQFVKLKDSDELVKITAIDEETSTIKTEKTGDNSVSASAIIKVDARRGRTIEGVSAIENQNGITTKVYVTGKDTGGVKKGRASGVELKIDEKGKVLGVSHDGKTYAIGDKELNVKDDNLKAEIGMLVLEDRQVKDPKEKRVKLGEAIYQKGDTYEVGQARIGKFKVTPDVTASGQVVGFTTRDDEANQVYYAFDSEIEIKDWVKTTKSKLSQQGEFGKNKGGTRKLSTEEKLDLEEEKATANNEMSFYKRGQENSANRIYPSVEKTGLPNPLKGGDAINYLNAIDMGDKQGSSTSKKAVVLRYFKKDQEGEPAYLVRTIRSKKDSKVIKAMGRRVAGKTASYSIRIRPLANKTGDFDINEIDSFEDDTDGGRLELVDVLTFNQEAQVAADFESEEEYNNAMEGFTDYEFIRSMETAEVQNYLKENVGRDDRANRIYELAMEGDKFNPLLEVYAPNLNSKIIDSLQKKILERAKDIADEEKSTLGKKLGTTKNVRIVDLIDFTNHIAEGKQGTKEYVSGFDVLSEGEFSAIKKAVRTYENKGGKVQKQEKGTGSDVLAGAVSESKVGEFSDDKLDLQKVEEELDEVATEWEVETLEQDGKEYDVHYTKTNFDSFSPNGKQVPRQYGDEYVFEKQDGFLGTNFYKSKALARSALKKSLKGNPTGWQNSHFVIYGNDIQNVWVLGVVYEDESNQPSDVEESEESPKVEEEPELEEQAPELEEQAPKVEEQVEEKKVEEEASSLTDQEKQIVDAMVSEITEANLSKSQFAEANRAIKNFEDGKTNIGQTYTIVTTIVEEAKLNPPMQSVGEIAFTENDLEIEIQRHIDEPKKKIISPPISEELQQENAEAVAKFSDGLEVDGKPVRLTALLNKELLRLDGSDALSGSLLDMAQTLLAHPFVKNLKVQFRSWDNFKDGIQNDGSNGKLTRAYIRGDTIVMGPFFKVSDTDLNAEDAVRVAFLEEVAHRVFATAVEASIQAKRKGKMPRGASKVLSMKQAIQFYDETKELMDWLRTQTDGVHYHGLMNMHEFWANFATNPKFRKFLNRPLPPKLARKFKSRFERVIDWVLDLASKIFDTDFTPQRTASDEIRKRYRTLLRTSDKLAANDVDLMRGAFESNDEIAGDSSFTDRKGNPIPRNADGTITVYHRTDADPEKVAEDGFVTKENTDEIFVSSSMDGQAEGYGENIIELRVKEENLELDDEFDGEVHFRVGIETANNSIVTQDNGLQMESADTIEQSVARGTLRAHTASLKDFSKIQKAVLADLGDANIEPERLKEFMTIDGSTTPDVIAKVIGKKTKLLAEEASTQFAEATNPNIDIDSVRDINDLETRANKDTGGRNLMKILAGARENVSNLFREAKTSKESIGYKVIEKQNRMEALTKPKSMFDAGKTQALFGRYLKSTLYNKSETTGEYSLVNAFEAATGLSPTSFSKLRELEIDEKKLYDLMDRLAEAQDPKDFIEQKTAKEIFDLMDIKAEDVGISDPELDQAVQVAVALMLGKDQKNDVPRSAFTTRMRLAPGRIAGHSVQEAVNLIKQASEGKPTPDVKDKSMMSILKNVRKLHEEIAELSKDMDKAKEEESIAKKFLEAYNDRIADLDEYFETTGPVELFEGAKFATLRLTDGKLMDDNFTYALGKGESSDEAKRMAAEASNLFKIMDTPEYKEQYEGTPEDRYFKQLAREMRKPNFGIQYSVSNVGFLHAAASSLQERMSRLGPAGKAVATLLNEYTRDYQAEAGRIFGQGKRVSGAIVRLHAEMAKDNGENVNLFMRNFGSKLFDWFNERPDLQGQEELAINKVWADLKAEDPDRNYTEEGKKALRAYLKQWSIQNENFQRLYRKYDISVYDEDVERESIATGRMDKLYRRFVDQGVYTTPRKLNMTKIAEVVSLLDPEFDYDESEDYQPKFFQKLLGGMKEAEVQQVDAEESFVQSLGKLVDGKIANLFFKPIFVGKSAHATPLTLTSQTDEGNNVRVLLPEELERAWRNAEGENAGIKVANAILDLKKLLPDSDDTTLSNLLGQFRHRANALIKAHAEATEDAKAVGDTEQSLSTMMSGTKLHSSIHARSLYNILPGEFFEYEMYDETSSGQHLSKILMTAKFGRKGEKLTENYSAIRDQYQPSYTTYKNLADELGYTIKSGSVPSKTNRIWWSSFKKKMESHMANKGKRVSFDQLDKEARTFVEAQKAFAAINAAFTSRSSNNQDISLGLEVLRTLAFGMVNTMKGAWTATMSIPDIVKRLGLNPTAFRQVGKTYANLAREVAGSFLESFGIEMLRADKYASELRDVFSREAGMMSFSENMTEIGKEGSLRGMQKGLRNLRNAVNSLSMIGAGQRAKTSGNYIPGSLLTPLTAPFTYLAQATNKSIALGMANTIEKFVIQTAKALDAKGVSLDNNTFEVKPSDLGYEDSKLDRWIFGSVDMVESLNQRLVSEGMSFTQLAQDYRRRLKVDPETKVLTRDAVLASYNIAMSEVTYDTMAGKGSWTQSGTGQFLSPLVGWSVSSAGKGLEQMKNKDGQLAIRESIRYMLMSTAWLVPAGIAFTMFTDWWDEEVLGKPSSLRKLPATAALPIIGLPLAATDPRFDGIAVFERAARANNVLGIVQEFASPLIIGQLDPTSRAGQFDPTRRVLAISSLMNSYNAVNNYFNAVKTSGFFTDLTEGEFNTEKLMPDYSNVVRPLMYSMGLNSVVQNMQMATHLTDIEDIDPTGLLATERQITDITGMRNSLRVYSKVMGMEMRKGGFMTYTATAMGNALKKMERAAYANDKEAFKEAYRTALSLSQAEDPRKDVIEKFKRKHIRQGVTRYALSDPDMQAILSVLSDSRRQKLLMSMQNHDFYLRGIGGSPTKPRKNTSQYSEELRRLVL